MANCFLPAVCFILLFFIPESPHWLISKNRLEDAKKSMAWLRGWTTIEDIEPEFKELYNAIGKKNLKGIDNPAFENADRSTGGKQSRFRIMKLFWSKTFFWPYSLICFIFFLGHFSGMTTLQTYAVQIFATLQTPVDKYYATVILGCVELIGCIICVACMNYAGKRVLNFISLIGSGICFFIVATYAYSTDILYLQMPGRNTTEATQLESLDSNKSNFTWVPTTFLIASALLSHVCSRTLPWILIGELFPNKIRSIASGLCGAMGYVFGFLSNKIFISLQMGITLPGIFWFYSSVSFVGSLILYFALPETEGKTLLEITDHFEGKNKLGKKVRRKHHTKYNSGNVNAAYVENGEINRDKVESDESKL